MNIQY